MPNWPNASKLSTAAKAEWDRVYAELDAHENRHVEILVNGATYIGNSALGSKKAAAETAAAAAKDSVNSDNVAIDPFETVMTTDIE
jgi:predicted secreted Zn-dependent protease